MIRTCRIGQCELFFLSNGAFSVDCGTHFGIIPKVIWQKIVKPDELNRVQLPICPLLVKTPQHNNLIDPGLGNKYTQKLIQIYNIQPEKTVKQSLHEIGLTVDFK